MEGKTLEVVKDLPNPSWCELKLLRHNFIHRRLQEDTQIQACKAVAAARCSGC